MVAAGGRDVRRDRRELVGRAWVLAAYLDWPGARVQAAAVLDDVLARSPGRPAAAVARGALALLEGDFERALAFATTAQAAPEPAARALGGGPRAGGVGTYSGESSDAGASDGGAAA